MIQNSLDYFGVWGNFVMRYLSKLASQDIENKMIFITGPRQCGKTTLAKSILSVNFSDAGIYLNWDNAQHRKLILAHAWNDEQQLVIFDELHKYKRWKNWIKGVYDVEHEKHAFIVTGSARLDVYRRGGDSLFGRYHLWHLHPFTLDERPDHLTAEETLKRLMEFGGFPEPFLKADKRFANRWRRERFERILSEDIRDVENVRDIALISLFAETLKARVAKPIAVSNIANDLEISPKTAKSWLAILERMYLGFAVYPYSPKNIARTLVKQPKFYFFDNADVESDVGARFENLVACHLFKRLQFMADSEGERIELRYIRDKDKREVDFVVLRDKKVDELIEVKYSEASISQSLVRYAGLLKPRLATQIVCQLDRSYTKDGIRVMTVIDYFADKIW